jgi:hypothetical protein
MKWLEHMVRSCYGPDCKYCARTHCPHCGDFLRLPSAVHSFNELGRWECRAILESRRSQR